MKYLKVIALCCALAAVCGCPSPSSPTTPTNPTDPVDPTDPTDPGDPAALPTKPVFNFSSGAYWGSIELRISATNAQTIYYTTDGSDPSVTTYYRYTLGTTPVTVSSSKRIRAVAVNRDGVASEVMSADYVIDGYVWDPTINLSSGAFNTAKTVTVTPDANSVVHYTFTTDKSTPADPTVNDPIYSGPITLAAAPSSEIYYTYKFKAFTTAYDPAVPRAATVSYVINRTWKIDTLPPPAPVGLKAKCYTGGSILLQWTGYNAATSDVRTYSVYYGKGSTPADAVTLRGTPSSYADAQMTGLENDARYSFVVNAIDEAGNVSLSGTSISWVPLKDYSSWGSLTGISLHTNNPNDDSTTFTKIGDMMIASLTGQPNGLDLYTLSDPATIHRTKRLFDKSYSSTASKGSAYYGLAYGGQTIDVIDMTTPASPVITGTLAAEPDAKMGVSADGAYLLVGLPYSQTVKIYDISNPNSPTLSATLAVEQLMGNLESIWLKDGYLTLDCGFSGAHFFSFASPTAITLVSTLDYASSTADEFIGIKGKYAIFGRSWSSVVTVRDITNIGVIAFTTPASPTPAYVEDEPRMMGNYLYAEGSRSNMNLTADLYRWDLSTLPTIGSPVTTTGGIPAYISLNHWSKLSASQYVVWDYLSDLACIFDVTTPTAPVFGTPFTFNYANIYSRVDGDNAMFFAVDDQKNLSIIRQSLANPQASEITYFKKVPIGIGANMSGFEQYSVAKAGSCYWFVVDKKLIGVNEAAGEFSLVSSPANFLTLPAFVSEVYAYGNLLVTADRNGIFLVDISTPSTPVLKATIANPFTYYDGLEDGSLTVSGDKLYVSSSDTLYIYNIATPSSPSLVGSLAYGASGYTGNSSVYCSDIVVQDEKAYLQVCGPSDKSKFLIIDVSDSAAPAVLGSTQPYTMSRYNYCLSDRISVRGNYGFVYGRGVEFAVIDVQDPTAPNQFSIRTLLTTYNNGYDGSMYFSPDTLVWIDREMNIEYAR